MKTEPTQCEPMPADGIEAAGPATMLAPAVSVVIACYNAARTLEATLASVAGQSFGDFEVIIVDDGSKDGSQALAREWADADSRFRLLLSARNQGPSLARKSGVEQSRAGIIAFLDADDIWSPEHLALHVAALRANPDTGVSFSPCAYIDGSGQPAGGGSRILAEDVTAAELLGSNPTTTCSALVVHRAVFDEAGHFRSDMTHAEDQEWLFRVACSGWAIRPIAERTVAYRRAATGLSADTRKMEAGWHQLVASARTLAPQIVSQALPRATASMHFYWARQAAVGGSAQQVRRHFLHGLRSWLPSAVAMPGTAVYLAGACVSPSLAARLAAIARSAQRV